MKEINKWTHSQINGASGTTCTGMSCDVSLDHCSSSSGKIRVRKTAGHLGPGHDGGEARHRPGSRDRTGVSTSVHSGLLWSRTPPSEADCVTRPRTPQDSTDRGSLVLD